MGLFFPHFLRVNQKIDNGTMGRGFLLAKNTQRGARSIGGFSLASMIVSAGIVGGLALGVAHIKRQTASSLKHTEISLAEAELMKRIQTLLYSSSACKNTLGKGSVVTGPIGALYTGTDSVGIGEGYTVKNIVKISGFELIVDNSALTDDDADGNKEGQISLSVKITRMSKAFQGVKEVRRRVNLSVVVDDDQIVSCHHDLVDAETTGLVTESMKKFCEEDLEGTYDPGGDPPCSY